MPRTQRERSTETQANVISAARATFAEVGFERASLAQIAAAAGVTKGALYHHYANKVELLAVAYEALEQEICERILAATATLTDPADALRVGCRVFLDSCLDPATRQLALVDAPAGLGWARWREIDSRYGFGLLRIGLQAATDLTGLELETRSQLLLASLMEGALVIAASSEPIRAHESVVGLINEQIQASTSKRDSSPLVGRPNVS